MPDEHAASESHMASAATTSSTGVVQGFRLRPRRVVINYEEHDENDWQDSSSDEKGKGGWEDSSSSESGGTSTLAKRYDILCAAVKTERNRR